MQRDWRSSRCRSTQRRSWRASPPPGLVLWTSGDGTREHGVWEITPGVVTDVEHDELFVVIAGHATIEVEGGPTLEVGPGHVGVLRCGDRTIWRVHETLRKVYVIEATDHDTPA